MKRLISAFLGASLLVAPLAAHAALKPGDTAPVFKAQAALAGKPYSFDLDAALKKGPVVLYFFPAAFTSGCTIEAHLFAEAAADFQRAGATLIGVTAGNIDRIQEFSVSECSNKFPVAADPGAAIAKRYKSTMMIKSNWSDRTSYVITPDHKIAYAYSALSPDKHVQNTLAAVRGLKSKA